MRKAIQVFLLASALFIGTASAADSTFLFGAWMYDTPRLSGTDIDSYISLLKDTLRFNTLLTTCYEQYHLDKYALHEMKLIIDNEYKDPTYIAGVDTSDIDFWPRIYGSGVYGFWESENNDIGPGDLFYYGGSTEMLEGVSVRHFRAQNFTVPMVIQTGPSENCGASCYGQIPWYYPQHKTGDSTYVYQLNLRFRLANDIDSVVDGDTLALFYIERTGIPFLEDTVIAMEAPVYLTDNLCSDSLSWSQSLSYVLNVPYCSSFMCHVVYGINFKVKWLKPCDIYIDQVKISTDFGRALWEPQDTAAAFKQIADWANAFFASAPNVLGYYLEDDQSLIVNRDNIPNMRRVDSLMANRLGISPRSLFPEMTLQYKR